MTERTRIRPPSLSSTAARQGLEHRSVAEFEHLFTTIEEIGAVYDGLVAVRDDNDPLLTQEARALKYREQHDRAKAGVQKRIQMSFTRISDRMERVMKSAYQNAGIAVPPAEASEIRSALRAMSDRDRNKAISTAIEQGDRTVIASLRNVSPMLIGPTTVPVDQLIGMYIDKMVPDCREQLADCEEALLNLDLARQAFEKGAEDMRDLKTERSADDAVERAKLADARLGLALQANGSGVNTTGG